MRSTALSLGPKILHGLLRDIKSKNETFKSKV